MGIQTEIRSETNPVRERIVTDSAKEINKITSGNTADFVNLLYSDYLTPCYGGRYLQEAVTGPNPEGKKYALIMINISGFRHINDTYGYVFGSHVLRKIGKTIRASIRKGDDVIRYYGDIFAVILYDITPESLLMRLEELAGNIEELEFSAHPEVSVDITAGGCFSDTLDMETLQMADAHLNKAKLTGRKIYFCEDRKSWRKEYEVMRRKDY